MSIDVEAGKTIRVTIVAPPTQAAAAKTLSRVFARSAANRRAREARKRLRENLSDYRVRGGRIWRMCPKAPRLCPPKKGQACTILATSSVLNDLRSVSRFVEVKSL